MSLDCVNRNTNLRSELSERKSKSIKHLDQSVKDSIEKKEVIKRENKQSVLFQKKLNRSKS